MTLAQRFRPSMRVPLLFHPHSLRALHRRAGFALLAAALLVWSGCGDGEGGTPVPAALPQDTVAADTVVDPAGEGEWVTLLERRMETRSRRPERFVSTSERLRIITAMGPNQTVHNAGFVVTNLLSDDTSLPVASVRAQQFRLDSETADTTEVSVPAAGTLYFYVAEHRRLADWTVTIQEFRTRR